MNRLIPRGATRLLVTVGLLAFAAPAAADHNSRHDIPCNEPDVVGGGKEGTSDRSAPPDGLGWDVGSGQCNGSFTITRDPDFPSAGGNGIELGLRIEERRTGQVRRVSGNDYLVELGPDSQGRLDLAFWNFHWSVAFDDDIDSLDALTFTIRTDFGPNLPAQANTDILDLREHIDARNNQPNPTDTFSDLYQVSQNPEFGWFAPAQDNDDNPTGRFDYDQEGAWLLTLTAENDGHTANVSICVHTPNARCLPDHYSCYRVDERTRLPRDLEVALADQFTREDGVKVRKAKEICAPTRKNTEGVLNPAAHLVCFDVRSDEEAKAAVEVTNQFTPDNPQRLRVKGGISRVCVPSLKEVVADHSRDDDDDDYDDD